ncbi:MAG: hypothetical protein LQ346_008735, partial [Caloplaca aetnensis]
RVEAAGPGLPAGFGAVVEAGKLVDLGRAAEGGVEGGDEGFQAGDVTGADAEVGFDDGPEDEEDAAEGLIGGGGPGAGGFEAEDREGDCAGGGRWGVSPKEKRMRAEGTWRGEGNTNGKRRPKAVTTNAFRVMSILRSLTRRTDMAKSAASVAMSTAPMMFQRMT